MIVGRETKEHVYYLTLEPHEQWEWQELGGRRFTYRTTNIAVHVFTSTTYPETITRVEMWSRQVLKSGALGAQDFEQKFSESYWTTIEPLNTLVSKFLGRPTHLLQEEEIV